jgi:murein DD-endopeptidase MepM/ murein hydrolase activator NlpD
MSCRRSLSIIFICALVLSLGAQELVHTVQKGETLYSISRTYGVSQEDILRLNNLSDPSRIQAGQRLRIPAFPATGVAPVTGSAALPVTGAALGVLSEYAVVRGDSFYGIARQFGTTVDAIRQANGLSESYVLKVGDKLKIPGTPGGTVPSGTVAGGGAPGTVAPALAAGALLWPVKAQTIEYMTGKTSGVMIRGEKAEPVRSISQGTVISAGPYRGFGQVIIVQSPGGYYYVYGGCATRSVNKGDRVLPGTELGMLGIDETTAQPELFFMVYKSSTPIDPALAPRT